MRALLVTVIALAAAAAAGAAEAPLAPLYGRWYTDAGESPPSLVRLDPASLKRTGSALRLVEKLEGGAQALSPDRTQLVLGGKPQLHFYDLVHMRAAGSMRLLTGKHQVYYTFWLTPRRLLLVTADERRRETFVLVDPAARRVLRRIPADGTTQALWRLDDRVLFLLGRNNRIVDLRLAIVDANASVRTVALRVRGGIVPGRRTWGPALTADPEGERAYVVEPDGGVAAIALRTLHAEYHFAVRTTAVRQKAEPGAAREARWLGDGLIAVTGWQARRTASEKFPIAYTPAGLELIDVRTWKRQLIDPRASVAAFSGGTLLTLGRQTECGEDSAEASIVSGYALDGSLRFRLCDVRSVGLLQTFADRYAYLHDASNYVDVIDIAAGKVIARSPRLVTIFPIAPFNFGGY